MLFCSFYDLKALFELYFIALHCIGLDINIFLFSLKGPVQPLFSPLLFYYFVSVVWFKYDIIVWLDFRFVFSSDMR